MDDEVTFDEAIAEVLGPDATDQWNMDGWLFRHRIVAKDRAGVLRRVFLNSDPRWLSAFIVMLLLSGAIATLGLSQDSAATVIGSMIVAPLGAPIVALGGAIAVVWPREAAKMFATVVAGAVAVVAVSYITGIFLPDRHSQSFAQRHLALFLVLEPPFWPSLRSASHSPLLIAKLPVLPVYLLLYIVRWRALLAHPRL